MRHKKKIYIVKANGKKEIFSLPKLQRSLARAGASPLEAEEISRQVASETTDGERTSAIYQRAMELLKNKPNPLAIRYGLKQGILQLGPSGHPFEDFVGEIFKKIGYSVKTRQMMLGRCGRHEVDVVARKNDEHIMVETKFHNHAGFKTDIKTALYVHARFEDILASPSRKKHLHEAWLVTNTKFTKDAIDYAACSGLKLLGWNYPKYNNLQQVVESNGLTPLTCLTALTASQKKSLIESGTLICRDLKKIQSKWRNYGIDPKQGKVVMEEIASVCSGDF